MLAVALVFAVIAFILFVERSGIRYNYDKAELDFMPKENIVTKAKANISLQKNTIILWDSTKPDSNSAMEEFSILFSDMKVGYDAVDLATNPFPDLSGYNCSDYYVCYYYAI